MTQVVADDTVGRYSAFLRLAKTWSRGEMNRRRFFAVVAGALAWGQTKHVAWAFPEAVHVIPQRFLYARIRVTREVIEDMQAGGAFKRFVDDESAAVIRDIQRRDVESWTH